MVFPEKLRYQWDQDLNISDKCCEEFKEKPLDDWAKEHNKKWTITGIMKEEGGRRSNSKCIGSFRGRKTFNPLSKVTKEWENWFIEKHGIRLADLYYEPYNFERTGCRGCPFNINLQEDLSVMDKYMPNERKACETTFKYVYDEYRRIGYRLTNIEETKLF